MKNILFLTDFSEVAQNAFIYALSIAEKVKAEIHILHIAPIMEVKDEIEELQVNPIANAYKNDLEKEEWGKFRSEAKKLERIAEEHHKTDVPVEFHFERGAFLEVTINYIQESNISLAIMGTSGANTIDKKLFGSNTENLINSCSIPILAIPEKAVPLVISNLSVAVLLNDSETPIISRLHDSATAYGYKLHCVHIVNSFEKIDEAKIKFKKWVEKFRDNSLTIELIVNENIEAGLMEYVHKKDIHILSIIHRDLSLWQRIFKINHSKNLLLFSDTALLVYNNAFGNEIKETRR